MEISIKDLFRIIKNGLWLMIITAVVFAVATCCYSKFFIQEKFNANVKLYVETSSSGNGSYNDLSAYNYATSLVNTYIEFLTTNNFYEKVSENLDGKYTAKEIREMVAFSNESETEVFRAKITANTPQEAKLVADSVAEVAPGVISKLDDNAKLKIVDYAVLPTNHASPNVTQNTLIAFVVGFVLAFLFIFIRELVDVKFKYNSDMTSYDGLPILAAIPSFDEETFSPMDYLARESEKDK